MTEGPLRAALARIRALTARPAVVALDGRSGVGKSTLAGQLALSCGALVIEGYDFYSGGVGILGDRPQARAARCIDWRDQRRVLSELRACRPAAWHAFDWDAFDGSHRAQATRADPAQLILLEGVYAARPELGDLVDQRLLLRVPDSLRLARLVAREGEIGPWERQWHEAEDWYFTHAAPAEGFDLVLEGAAR